MSATHFDADDAAQDRALERRKARARARGEDPDAVDLDAKASAVAAAKGKPGPAPKPPAPKPTLGPVEPVRSAGSPRAFTPVLALPSSRAASQPKCRQELIEYAITHRENAPSYPHHVRYLEPHRFPRWSWFGCVKCRRLFEVHDSEWSSDRVWNPHANDCPLLNPPRVKAVTS